MKLSGRRAVYFVVFIIMLLVMVGFVWMRKQQGPELVMYQIQNQSLVQTVVATGRVSSASRAQVGAQITGVIVERRVREGDEVQAGEVLAVLRADDLLAHVGEAQAELDVMRQSSKPQADAALMSAKAQYEQTSRELKRRQDLLKRKLIANEALELAEEQNVVALAALEQAKLAAEALTAGNPSEVAASERLAAARAVLDKTVVRAQVSGTVLTRNAEPGDVVQPGRVLFEIARDGQVELLVPVDERNLSVLRLGQQALCVTDAFPDRPFPATVSFIAPAVDPQRGSVDIRLQLESVPDFLRQDMTVTVNVETGRRDKALVVPNDALEGVNVQKAQVWRFNDGRVQRVQVALGLRGLAMTEVISGLASGDWIVTNADASLVDGGRVRKRRDPAQNNNLDTSTAGETPVKFN